MTYLIRASYVIYICCGTCAIAQLWPQLRVCAFKGPAGFVERRVISSEGNSRKYVLFVPRDYRNDKRVSLIVYLHSDDELGYDGRLPLSSGLGVVTCFLDRKKVNLLHFILFVQSERSWRDTDVGVDHIISCIKDVEKDFAIDDSRVYLTGIQEGSIGIIKLAARFPDKWAAAAFVDPIVCAGDLDEMSSIPTRVYLRQDSDFDSKSECTRYAQKRKDTAEMVIISRDKYDVACEVYGTTAFTRWLDQQERKRRR